MAYMNLDLDFPDHPKTRKLVALYGDNAEMYFVRIIIYACKYHDTGNLEGYSPQGIESIAKWKGASGELVDFFLRVGFLDKLDNQIGFKIHDFMEHQGHVKALRERARNAAKMRWKKYAKMGNTKRMLEHMPGHEFSNAPSIPSKPINKPPNPLLKKGEVDLMFEAVWKRYPIQSRINKKKCFKIWRDTVKTDADVELINSALNVYLKTERVGKNIIQNANTWFGHWQDYANMDLPSEDVVDRAKARTEKGLSPCHGTTIYQDDDKVTRCSSCCGELKDFESIIKKLGENIIAEREVKS